MIKPFKISIFFFQILIILFFFALPLPYGIIWADTNVGGIINSDTTWSLANSPYNLINKVQIAFGSTLTIEPGVVINGNGHGIQVYGVLEAIGTKNQKIIFNNTAIKPGNYIPPEQFLINIQYSKIKENSSIYAATGYTINGSLVLKDSNIKDNPNYIYLHYPASDSYIERNTFINSAGISVGVSDVKVYIRNNVFYQQEGNFCVDSFATYGTAQIIVEYNSFLSTDRFAFYCPGSQMTTINNYWNTTDTNVIDSMIYDKNDDLSCVQYISYLPILTSPHPDTPKLEFSLTLHLPQTGQTKCYDSSGTEIPCAGTGQDGAIRAGAGWPNPRFLDNGNATMTDKLTGLIWAKDGSGPTFGTCTGGDYKYWDGAIDYVNCLNNNFYLGHNDWRLPNVNELESLVNLTVGNPSEWLKTQGFNVIGWRYWSSTTYAEHTEYAWYIYLDTGVVDWMYKGLAGRAWPVRGGQQNEPNDTYAANVWKTGLTQSYYAHDDGNYQRGVLWPNPRFSEYEAGAIKDKLTGIIWTKDGNAPGPSQCNPSTTKSWQSALDYIACLNTNNYLGYNDWRLPNRKELWSILDRSNFNPVIQVSSPFINISADKYWVSSYLGNLPSSAWFINMYDGKLEGSNKNNNHYVWPIRGGVFTVVANSLGNGTVNPETQLVTSNDAATITINPSEGYHISKIKDNGYEVPVSAQYTINNVTASHDVVVTFAINTYTISVTSGSGGSIFPPGPMTINYGGNRTFTITPNTGYHLVNVLVDGASVGAVTSYTFNNVTSNHTISATFAINTYTITVTSGSGGTVTPGSTVVNYGASQTFSIMPNTGYHLVDVLVDGVSVGAVASYPFNNVTANHTISATFAINSYAVTALVGGDPLGGSVTPSSRTVDHGASTTFTVTTNTGYTGSVSEGTLAGTTWTIPNVTSNHTATVTFMINSYTVTASVGGDPTGGFVAPSSCNVNHGASATFTVTTNTGYTGSVSEGTLAGTTWTIPNVTSTHTATMNFTLNSYILFIDDFTTEKGWLGYGIGGWERGPAEAGGGENGYPDPGIDYSNSSDNNILGFAIGDDYPNDLVEKSIISPPIDCTGQDQVFLKFRRHLNVEGNEFAHARIYISVNGTDWTQVWENPVIDLTDDQWTPVVLDISSIAANQGTVYIKFTMGPVNSSRRFSGWNIDDFEVTSEAVFPSEGTYGTELVISGSGFGLKKGKVFIDNTALTVSGSGGWMDDLIKGSLKKVMSPGIYDVVVQPVGPKGTPAIIYKEAFVVRPAEIHSIERGEGSAYDQVTITGKFFGMSKGRVYLEYEKSGSLESVRKGCTVSDWDMDTTTGDSEIVFVVPVILPAVCDVIVDPYSTIAETEEEDGFSVKAPEIESVDPKTGSVGDEVTISGKFFGSKKPKVYLGYLVNGKYTKKGCTIISWPTDPTAEEGKIIFVVPKGLLPKVYDVIITNSVVSNMNVGEFTVK